MPVPGAERHTLRASCEQQVDRLHLPYRFDTRALCDAISALRGKPIVLKPMNTLGVTDAPCGIRVETPDADFLFYEEGTSVHHQRHILTHELCHVYCDHPGTLEFDTATGRVLGIDPTLVLRMSGRTGYSTAEEREAEMMATIIRQRIYQERQSPSRKPGKGPDSWDALFAQPARNHSRSRAR